MVFNKHLKISVYTRNFFNSDSCADKVHFLLEMFFVEVCAKGIVTGARESCHHIIELFACVKT